MAFLCAIDAALTFAFKSIFGAFILPTPHVRFPLSGANVFLGWEYEIGRQDAIECID
jgi:hypothetical protein